MSWIEHPEVSKFEEFDLGKLCVDEAWLRVLTTTNKGLLWLYELSSNCVECPFQLSSKIAVTGKKPYLTKKINTEYPLAFRLRTSGEDQIVGVANDSKLFCELTYNFGEFGVYDLKAGEDKGSPLCEIVTKLDPVNIYLPILLTVLFYFSLTIIWCIVSKNKGSLQIHASSIVNRLLPQRQGRVLPDLHPSTSSSSSLIERQTNTGGTILDTSRIAKSKFKGKKKTISQRKEIPSEDHSCSGQMQSEHSSLSEEEIVHREKAKVLDPDRIEETISDSRQQKEVTHPEVKINNDKRFRFLDTFRGICIVIMIFVNDGAAEYSWLEHATWDGLHLADLVFPWFLMGMGISIPLSITAQIRKGSSIWQIFVQICIRSCKLIFIGVALNTVKGSNPTSFAILRLPGVLQRFGICYFTVALLYLLFTSKKIASTVEIPEEESRFSSFKDIKMMWIPWIIVVHILLLHFVLTFFVLIPGCPMGYLGPGGLHKGNAYPGYCVGGSAGYIDRILFSTNHMYKWPTAKSVYKCESYDPEGFLGLLNSIGQVWFGLVAGVVLLVYPKSSSRISRWITFAVITGIIGISLCEGKQTGGWIPINKNLWSLSYTLVTTSMALFLFSILYIVVDVKMWWSGSPFFECGMNSIALYIGHTIAYAMLPWHFSYGRMCTHFSHLIETLWGTTLWILIAVYLYNNRLFYSI